MNVKELSMMRLFVVFVLIISVVMVSTACRKKSGGGGGGGVVVTPPPDDPLPPPQPPILFSSAEQAATASAVVNSARALMDAELGAAMLVAESSRPVGFAAGLGKTGSDDLSGINPTLASMVEKMRKMASSPVIQNAVSQVNAFKAKRVNELTNVSLTADFCIAGGSASFSGTNNYDDVNSTSLTSEYFVTFTDCKDSISLTGLSGTLDISMVEGIETNAGSMDVTVVLTEKHYSDTTFTTIVEQHQLTGSFSESDQVTSGARAANGRFIQTTPAQGSVAEAVTTLTYDNLTETRTLAHNADQSDTDTAAIAGDFTVTEASGGVTSSEFSMKIALTDTTQTMNDQVGTRKNWLDGTVETAWTPDKTSSGCLSGTLELSTPDDAPRTFSTATGFTCPASGTVNINNSATTYGSSITVAIDGGASVPFASCTELAAAGGVCGL